MPRRREVRVHVVPSYAWSLALLKPSHKSSSSSYNLLAVLGCLFFSVCFFMRKNSFWLLAPRLDFSMCLFKLFLRSKHYLDSTKNQQIQEARQGLWEVYSQTSNPNVVSLPPEHFVSNSTSDFVDCLPRVLWDFLIRGFTILIFHSNRPLGVPPDIELELAHIWGLQRSTCFVFMK